MPYTVRGKCVYKKNTGKKVGCTTGPVRKYLAALNINAHEEGKASSKITQKDVMSGVRKSMPPPTTSHKDKKKYNRKGLKNFKDYYESMVSSPYAPNMPDMNGDQTGVQEGEYAANTGDQDPEPVGQVDEVTNKKQIIHDIISDLEDLKVNHNWSKPLDSDLIKAMAQSLRDAGVEPTDFDAAVDATPEAQEQYLITGPSSWKGGQGALKDLNAILKNATSPDTEIDEDESNPASDLPFGTTSMGDPLTQENFIDHKGPGRPGDSKRHGIKKHSSLSSLDKIVHSKTASPRKKQLAHWQANMRRGHKR
jgi:hypothetical protein